MTELRPRTVLLTLAGSQAHGTARAQSDIDIAGVAVPTPRQMLGLFQAFEHANSDDEIAPFVADLTPEERIVAGKSKLEGTVYSLQKFLKLATSANPNILELLYCRDEEIRRIHPIGEALRANRHLFLTAKCRHTFGGYASSQLARIQLHYRWHVGGEIKAPTRKEFGLPEMTTIPRKQIDAAEAAVRTQLDRWNLDLTDLDPATRIALEAHVVTTLAAWKLAAEEDRWTAAARWVGLDDNLILVMQNERRWRSARNEYKRYQSWLKNRNATRYALEAKYGYDTKHGAHLVRLLRMGIEIVKTGEVHVWRGDMDAEELAYIRDGGWSYEALCDWSKAAAKTLATSQTTLPKGPDFEAIGDLALALTQRGFEAF